MIIRIPMFMMSKITESFDSDAQFHINNIHFFADDGARRNEYFQGYFTIRRNHDFVVYYKDGNSIARRVGDFSR